MEFRVLDEDFVQVHVLDVFESAIWTDRFFEAGDFKIKLPLTVDNYTYVLVGRYVWNVRPHHDDREDRHRLFFYRRLDDDHIGSVS